MKLVTQRLVLREVVERDFAAFFELYNDCEARQYEQSGDRVHSEADVRNGIQRILADQKATPRTRYRFAITISPDDWLRGWVSLRSSDQAIGEWEMGWTVHRAAWNQGYATEAACEVLRFAFHELGAHRVIAACHVENVASARVMEKLGMRCEGRRRGVRTINDAWVDDLLYAILEVDYKGG
jgi:RimJ/RimL family protein N-acetyltransferase